MRGERRRARVRQKKEQQKKILIFAASGLGVALLVALAIFIFSPKTNYTSAIVQQVPRDFDVVFVSDANAGSWKYMETLAGSEALPDIQSAESVGMAWSDGISYLYVAGDPKQIESELETHGLDDAPRQNGVFILNGEKAGFSDNNLYDSLNEEDQALAGSASFAYINGQKDLEFFEGDSGMPTEEWKWTGIFQEGRWVGQTEGIMADDVDLNALESWAVFEQKPEWVAEAFQQTDDGLTISLLPEHIQSILGLETLETAIDDINIIMSNDGTMEVSIRG